MQVLTIDFDIIMYPSILLYDDNLDKLQENQFTKEELKYDEQLYQKLTEYIKNCYRKLKDNHLYFIQNHDQVCDIINRQNINQFELINIDFHHDIYNHEDGNNIFDCGNWVNYLYLNHKLKSYQWIHASNSDMTQQTNLIPSSKITMTNINDVSIDELSIPDYLILCLSPAWIPQHLHSLFFDWIALTPSFFGYSFNLVEPGMTYKNMV